MSLIYDYSGKVAVVTGASGGLGKEMARQFIDAGANVAICDFNVEKGEETAKELNALNKGKAIFCKVDVRSVEDILAAKKAILDTFGTVDFLVNNAGVAPGKKQDGTYNVGPPITNIDYEDWDRLVGINLMGSVKMVTEFSDIFKEKKDGKIVNLSSIAGYMPSTMQPHYSASKSAINSFTQAMSLELGPYNVNVNAVAPGFIYTAIYSEGGADAVKSVRKGVKAFEDTKSGEEVMMLMAKSLSAMQRPQLPSDIANAVMFLCSDASKEISGQVVNVDSGVTIR